MPVRSYSSGKRDEEVHRKRGPINRDNNTITAENHKSKTQKRKANKPAHMAGRRG